MEALPAELWLEIVSKLSYRDIISVSLTCRCLFFISSDAIVWSSLINRDYPEAINCTGNPREIIENLEKQKVITLRQTMMAVERRVSKCKAGLLRLELAKYRLAIKLKEMNKELYNLERGRITWPSKRHIGLAQQIEEMNIKIFYSEEQITHFNDFMDIKKKRLKKHIRALKKL